MKISDNEFFRHATLRVCRHLELEKTMSSLLLYLKQYMPVEAMRLNTYRRDLGGIETIMDVSEGDTQKINRLTPLPRETLAAVEKGVYQERGFDNGIKIVNRPEEDLVSRAFLGDLLKADDSMLLMLLKIGGHEIGMMSLRTKGRDRYRPEHARLFALIREPMSIAVYNTLKHYEVLKFRDMLADQNRYLRSELDDRVGTHIIGDSFGLRESLNMVNHVAPLDSPVLLLGETGVGKELIANSIHKLSPRKEGPFIKVNCGAIPESLVDSELFGHEKGAFTGAVSRKRGRFERAHAGTIFLDEIGELNPQAQIRLLRVIQFGELERVGGTETVQTDIRIIAATHKDLKTMVHSGKFRQDLYFRINVFPINIPPLRERGKDIPTLVRHFIEKKAKEINIHPPPALAPGAMEKLTAYHWPGNVRELENIVERELILSDGRPMAFNHFMPEPPVEADATSHHTSPPQSMDEVIESHIRRTLAAAKGKVFGANGAAEVLHMNPNTLRSKMRKYGIPFGYGKL